MTQATRSRAGATSPLAKAVDGERGRFTVRAIGALTLAAAVTLATGCASLSPGSGQAGIQPEPPRQAGTAGARSDRLNASVTTSATAAEFGPCVQAVEEAIKSALLNSGFRIDPTAPDILVAATVGATVFDQSGNYLVYDGEVAAKVTRAYDESLLGQQTLQARGERLLGKDKALRSAGGKLADATTAWLKDKVSPASTGLTGVKLTVSRAWRPGSDEAYARRLIDRVSAINGVVACRQISHDYEARKMVFRVSYIQDLLPEGILNRLVNDADLNLKPGK